MCTITVGFVHRLEPTMRRVFIVVMQQNFASLHLSPQVMVMIHSTCDRRLCDFAMRPFVSVTRTQASIN